MSCTFRCNPNYKVKFLLWQLYEIFLVFCIVQHYVLSGESRVTSRHSLGSRRLLLPYIVDRVDRVAYNLQFFVEGKNLALVRQVVISYIAQVFWRGRVLQPQVAKVWPSPVPLWRPGVEGRCLTAAPLLQGHRGYSNFMLETSKGRFIWDLFVLGNIACKNQLQLKSSRFQAKRSGMRFYFSCLSLSNFVTEEAL